MPLPKPAATATPRAERKALVEPVLSWFEKLKHAVAGAKVVAWCTAAEVPAGSLRIDPFPNPKQFLLISTGILDIAFDCGREGFGIEIGTPPS